MTTPDRREARESRGFRVYGRVQGVGFRQWTHRTAVGLGLSGTVRNLPDGSVEVRAQGAGGALRELEGLLKRGPVAARVDRVESVTYSADTHDEGFRITH